MFNSCNNISALRRASIHQVAVKYRCKQEDPISRLSDAFELIDSGMSLVHVYGHHNSSSSDSTSTPLAYLNVILDALAEYIMVPFLLSLATRNEISVGFLYPYGLTSVSIHGFPVHPNLDQSIAYEISKRQLLHYWDNQNLYHMADIEVINLTSFKQARDNNV